MDTKTLCLGILTLGDASGYDIRKHIDDNFGHFMDVSSNAVYPALKALDKEGLVTHTVVKQDNYPDKKIYSLTPQGRTHWQETLQVLPPRHKVRSQLMLLMFFADMLPPSRLEEIMQERLLELRHWRGVCKEWQKNGEEAYAKVGPSFLVDYALAMMEAQINFIEKNKDTLVKKLDDKQGTPS